jgi:hypothetical protein
MRYFLSIYKKIVFAGLLAFVAAPLFARDVEITVIDTELDLPLEGAIIRSWDGSRHICDENGKAVIDAPDDRQVTIRASYPGYETGRLVITTHTGKFMLGLQLSEIIQGRELVLEASRYGERETRTGRSVAVSGRDITQTAEIGGVEDVIASVKLLPGVISTEFADAQPSIRGGEPGDASASLDGFYVAFPYYWGGAFSIFDPRMIESAQLSHGVFSSRHGNTISGLIDITSKKPSPTETEFELGISASAASLNLSIPFAGRGGILFMGRVTYIDPLVFLAKQLTKIPDFYEDLAILINSINTAPYIRSGTITGNYRFTDNLELRATTFFGADGIGYKYETSSRTDGLNSDESLSLDYAYYQGFLTTSLLLSPRSDMLVKFSAGAGFRNYFFEEEDSSNIYEKSFSQNFKDKYGVLDDELGLLDLNKSYLLTTKATSSYSEENYNIQSRLDYDWEFANNFLFAAGFQEMISIYSVSGNQNERMEKLLGDYDYKEEFFTAKGITDPGYRAFLEKNLMISSPALSNNSVAGNNIFTTSLYGLIEYLSPGKRFGLELGLRADHYYLSGGNQPLGTMPVLNPRLNLDFNLLRNRFIFESINLTAGTGLFSSIPAEVQYLTDEIKPTRSWTSVAGAKLEFPYGMNINIEGYYKHIYDRMYIPQNYDHEGNIDIKPYFNGIGRVWGIDLILQKTHSRFWDGWISYSYNWTQHRDPDAKDYAISNEWYFPYYHRFHSLNLVLNIKPVQTINIYIRFGLAGGVQVIKRDGPAPESHPVYMTDTGEIIEKYYWNEVQDKNNRTTPLMQMDIKMTIFGSTAGKTRYEVYTGIENILSLLYVSQGNTYFNQYTGEIGKGRTSASYSLPYPIPSFGLKFSY